MHEIGTVAFNFMPGLHGDSLENLSQSNMVSTERQRPLLPLAADVVRHSVRGESQRNAQDLVAAT